METGKEIADRIAKEILEVQPMNGALDGLKTLYENSLSKEELERQGYKPVSRLGLMWVKE